MTEYELIDVVASYASGGGTFFTIWLTILSAYAITAYVAGRDFSSFQVVWLNTLYIFCGRTCDIRLSWSISIADFLYSRAQDAAA